MANQDEIEEFIMTMLEDEAFEEVLEWFDVTPEEAFWKLYLSGMIDEEILYDYMRKRPIESDNE